MNKLILVGLLLLFFDQADGQSTDPVDYAIYSKVLNAFLKDERIKGGTIVLESSSENKIEIDQSAMLDTAVAKLSYKLDSVNENKLIFEKFELKSYQLVIVTDDDLAEMFKDDVESGWRLFYRRYPNSSGLIRMSKMFLSPSKTWGLLYISISRRGLNGTGFIIKFDLKDKKVIKTKERIWIS